MIKKTIVISGLCLVFGFCSSPTEEINAHEDELKPCYCVDTVVVDSLKPNYPFDKARRIVSYHYEDKRNLAVSDDSIKVLVNGKFNRDSIIKEIDITEKRTELERIFRNKTEKCPPPVILSDGTILSQGNLCMFVPHHCIVFYDENDQPFEYVEICFLCFEKRASTKFGLDCDLIYCQLRDFLYKAGHEKEKLFWGRECKSNY